MLDEKSSTSPKISIGIVVFNGVEHIKRALDSVIGQPYKNIELIVMDGGSTDGTQNVLNEYAEHFSVLVSESDKGIYDAMNKVCSLANGDWLIFLGCDDILVDTLGTIAGKMTNSEAVYYGDTIFSSTGAIFGGKFSKYRLMQHNICHQAMFYPRHAYKNNSYDLNYEWLADYEYNIRLLGKAYPFVYLAEIVSIFNDKGGSSLGDVVFEKKKLQLIRESFGIPYVLLEIAKRIGDRTAVMSGTILKRILPNQFWQFVQSVWRNLRNRY